MDDCGQTIYALSSIVSLEIVQRWIRYPKSSRSWSREAIASAASRRAATGRSASIHIEGIKCYAVTSGACWLAVEGAGEPVLLKQGDCFLLPHGWPFRVASDPALPPDDWKRHFLGSRDGALVKLNDGGGVTVLGGHFQLAGPQAEMLLGMLPPIVHLQSETDRETLRWAFDRMRQELVDRQAGKLPDRTAARLHDLRPGAPPPPRREQGRRLAVCALRQACGGGDRGDPSRAGAALDGGGAGRSKSACRDPVSRRDLGNWSATDRSNISRAGGCCSPDAACRAANPSARSPARSGMNRKARSARPSSA